MASLGVRHNLREAGRRHNRKGVPLNVMIVGRSGLGKSTLLRTLVGKDFFPEAKHAAVADPIAAKTIEVVPVTHELDDLCGNRLLLTLVDTPGFGDSIDNTDSHKQIEKYILEQYERFLAEESRIERNPKFLDTRVHALLYMITPSGHSLKELDVAFMKALAQRVNIIPVIAKADTFAEKELANFKRRVMEDIARYDIPVYTFPDQSDEEDEVASDNKLLRNMLPFAVIGSDAVYDVGGHQVHGRKYPWGVVQVENVEHCDFLQLQNMLFNSHLHVLREVTHDVHYENYRRDNLSQTGVLDSAQIEAQLQQRERAMTQAKMAKQQEQQQAAAAMQAQAMETAAAAQGDDGEVKKKKTVKKAAEGEDGAKPKKKKDKDLLAATSAESVPVAVAADEAMNDESAIV